MAKRPDKPEQPPGVSWIDPAKVKLVVRPGGRRVELQGMGGRVEGGDWDAPREGAVEDLATYRGLRERVVLDVPWEQTEFYRGCVASIEAGEPQWNCSTEEAFRRACEEFERIYEEIRMRGYLSQAELADGRADHEIKLGVRRDGRLLFITGRRRFCAARLLGVPAVPAQLVVRHADWDAFKRELADEARSLGAAHEPVDHPDLADLPGERTEELDAALGRGLHPYEGRGLRVVEIGAGWGQRCRRLEARGFACTAVERDPRTAEIAERLRVATESAFAVWRGDYRDFPEPGAADVVVSVGALRGGDEGRTLEPGLARFAGALEAEAMVAGFDSPAEAELVARAASLHPVEPLGGPAGGPALYRLGPASPEGR
jgi:hypothetical protein